MWLGTVGCPTIKSCCVENFSARLNDWFLGYQSLAVSRLVVAVARRRFTLVACGSSIANCSPISSQSISHFIRTLPSEAKAWAILPVAKEGKHTSRVHPDKSKAATKKRQHERRMRRYVLHVCLFSFDIRCCVSSTRISRTVQIATTSQWYLCFITRSDMPNEVKCVFVQYRTWMLWWWQW